ncbi:MAG: pilus assembly protein PilP [Deltaproteobacteria bacterium]|nr:pilus assembly protein PilP [Deltaproteobacteria bacterium]
MKAWVLGGLLAALVLGPGCSRENANAPTVQDYEQKRAELMKRSKGQVVQQRAAKPGEPAAPQEGLVAAAGDYTYVAAPGRRDPFRSFIEDQKQRLAKTERGPLEQFDLSQLTVVAVVWGTGRPRALVEDPSGRGYVVQVGTPIGKNDGSVTSISDNAVTVRETYVDYLGAQTQKEIEMRTRSTTQGG